MEGSACSFTGCRTRDFLPFVCDLCKKTFCIEHRSRFAHNCHSSNAARSRPSPTSYSKTSDIFAGVESRFDNNPQGSTRTHLGVKSSAVPAADTRTVASSKKISKLDSIAQSAQNSKDKNIAGKTKQILFKKRAEGNDSIAPEDRFYVEALFDLTRESRYLYFSVHATIGEVLRDIARSHTILSFGQPVTPEGSSLAFFSDDPSVAALTQWQQWDRNVPLSQTVPAFSSLHIISVPTSEVLEAQSHHHSSARHPSSETKEGEGSVPAPSPATAREYVKGDRIVHTSSNGVRSHGTIVAVHRDDIELYYTVRLRSDDGEVRERQTDAGHLTPDAAIIPSAQAPSAQTRDQGKCADHAAGTCSIKVSFRGKTQLVNGVLRSGTVASLKGAIAAQLGMGESKQKLIYKGRVLRNDALKLGQGELRNIESGVVMLMTEK